MKNYIIALEGIDGSGKSTLAKLLCKEFHASLYERTKKGKCLFRLVNTNFMQTHYMLQIPIYLFLSYKNYIAFLLRKSKEHVIIMDRCFLSNICYFYPAALDNPRLLNFIMKFEINLIPDSIFIIDVEPELGRKRDNNRKTLKWMYKTKTAYLYSEKSALLAEYNIHVIKDTQTLEKKCEIIIEQIRRKIKW